jgi:hypothetical protein
MATNEAEFKSDFRKDLENEYPNANIWTNTDLVRGGLPDFCVLDCGLFVAVEAKFIESLPKNKGSKTLKHPVSGQQQEFLRRTQQAGSPAIVLIGSPQTAVVLENIKENYTLEEVLKAKRISRINGKWQVKGFLDGWRK